MDFLDDELEEVRQSKEDFRNNYQSSCGFIGRNFALFHTLQYLIHVHQQLNLHSQSIDLVDLKQIRWEDSSDCLGRTMRNNFKRIIAQKEKTQQVSEEDMFEVIISSLKQQILATIACLCLEAIFRLVFIFFIVALLEAATHHRLKESYILAAILMVFWYLTWLFSHYAAYLASNISVQAKSGLLMLLYAKITKLTSFVLKSAELGKITNLLGNELGVKPARMYGILSIVSFPILIVGSTIFMAVRMGWPAIAGIATLMAIIPFINCVSKKNGQTINEVNQHKDKRIKITSEIIEGIKFIKMYGWEMAFKKIIQDIRNKQIDSLWKLVLGRAIAQGISNFAVFFSSLVVFVLSHLNNVTLSQTKIFSSLVIMAIIKASVVAVVDGIATYYELKVVLNRFANVFNLKNKAMIDISDYPSVSDNRLPSLRQGDVIFYHFNGYWKEDFSVPSLKDIHFHFNSRRLYGITGKVGSGKSGLLGAMLGEIPYYSGKIAVRGSIAYVEQEPIIFSDTIRNNIIFGQQFEEQRYQQVIEQSRLSSDIKMLPEGEFTIVGEKGITLSGGQKARLSLARALYSDSDIYLLDDPISAVDSKVAKEIFQDCLKPLSQSKTVILITHQLNYIYECQEVIVMEEGRIKAQGSPNFIKDSLTELQQAFYDRDDQEKDKEEDGNGIAKIEILKKQSQALVKQKLMHSQEQQGEESAKQCFSEDRFFEKEVKVSASSYKRLFFSNKANYVLVPVTLLLLLFSEFITTIYYRILASYDNVVAGKSSVFQSDLKSYWLVVGMLVVSYLILLIAKYFAIGRAVLNASKSVHQKMVESLLRSPCSYFDSTPSGVLINKFSNDLSIIDINLASSLIEILEGPACFLMAVLNLWQINPLMIGPTLIIVAISIWFFIYSRPVSIKCKELQLQKRSHIFHFYSETANGLIQIRINNQKMPKIRQFSEIVNNSSKTSIAFLVVNRGFGFYESLILDLLMIVGLMLGISLVTDQTTSHLFAVTLVYLVTVSSNFQYVLREIIVVEGLMVSGQRILQLSQLDQEKELRTEYDRAIGISTDLEDHQIHIQENLQWPTHPSLQLQNFSARYREGLPLILKDISFQVKAGEKIGIVGRTGAGKSSIIQALFRIFQPEIGSKYTIDKLDALQMGLHSLRQNISVIPQVPFLFKGSVRQNIDPLDSGSEEQIWKALQQSGLDEHVRNLEQQLQTSVSNNSEAFSVGQKQLLCLARALFRRNKFLILDEATSNVDMKTDAFIQSVIRDHFKDTTVITIAHRLSTIADYDRVIVMHGGKVVEMGAPFELIQRKGLFYEMVQHSGKNAEAIARDAKTSYQAKRIIHMHL